MASRRIMENMPAPDGFLPPEDSNRLKVKAVKEVLWGQAFLTGIQEWHFILSLSHEKYPTEI